MWWLTKHKKVDIVAAGWLEGMTDIHCHLVPAVDDGSRSLDETRQLIEAMHSVGIQRIITTPHIYRRYPHNDSDTLRQAIERLLPELSDLDMPLTLGAEHMLDEGAPRQASAHTRRQQVPPRGDLVRRCSPRPLPAHPECPIGRCHPDVGSS